jgi:phosphatidylinositol-bisphosphatase
MMSSKVLDHHDQSRKKQLLGEDNKHSLTTWLADCQLDRHCVDIETGTEGANGLEDSDCTARDNSNVGWQHGKKKASNLSSLSTSNNVVSQMNRGMELSGLSIVESDADDCSKTQLLHPAVCATATQGHSNQQNKSHSRRRRGLNSNQYTDCKSDSEEVSSYTDAISDTDYSSSNEAVCSEPRMTSTMTLMATPEEDECYSSVGDLQTINSYRSVNRQLPTAASSELFMRSVVQASLDQNNGNAAGSFTSEPSIAGSSASTAVLPVPTKEARNRSYLAGSLGGLTSILGSTELENRFPDRTMRVFVGTWNMGGMRNVPTSLDSFLLPETFDFAQDMYVIGSQESVPNRLDWELKMQETLGPYYVLFHSGSHGTLHLAIFLRRDLIWYCSVSEEATVTTRSGPSGIKTKGAIGVSFHFFGTSFLFINSHFTAHYGRMDERIEDYKKIMSGLDLPKTFVSKQYSTTTSTGVNKSPDVTSRFDCVFWFGDLNCRLQMIRDRLETLIQSSESPDRHLYNYDEVVQHDELRKTIDEGLAFHNFQEGRIKFRPTYKYDIGTNNFDTSKKLRIPSYTDRVLFRCRKKNSVVCLSYDAAIDLQESDHKPVYGLFEVKLRPGIDTIPLSGGQFNRTVWLQGCRKRAVTMLSRVNTGQAVSSICGIM